MLINKWSYITKTLEKVDVGNGNFKYYSNNMNEIINCPHCKKELRVGNSYTSREFFSENGFWGYMVCEICHNKELKKEGVCYNE